MDPGRPNHDQRNSEFADMTTPYSKERVSKLTDERLNSFLTATEDCGALIRKSDIDELVYMYWDSGSPNARVKKADIVRALCNIASGNLDSKVSLDPTEAEFTHNYASRVVGSLFAMRALQSLSFAGTCQ